MELPKVVIRSNYNDYLQGKEAVAEFLDPAAKVVWPGERVMAYKHCIASETGIPVPKKEQSHYIGIEGTVTRILHDMPARKKGEALCVEVKKT
jgi:hypothetical protein